MKACRLVVMISLSAATTGAQSPVYSPAPLAYHRGFTSTGYPFGYSGTKQMTYQQVHGDLPKTPVLFKNLAWRPFFSSKSHGSFTTTLTMTFGLNGPNPDNALSTFATNLGPNPSVVINNKQITIPAYTKPSAHPADFVYALPLPTVYIYLGKGTFCWEVRMHNHTQPGSLSFDLFHLRTTPVLQMGGLGCTASGMSTAATVSGSYSTTNGTMSLSASNMPAVGGTLLLLGTNNTPVDLRPIGAPCSLRTDIMALAPGVGSGSSATWSSKVPATAGNGTAFFLQAGAADPNANNLGLVFSNGLCALWPYTSRPCVRIWSTSGDKATTGTLQLIYGLIIKLSM